MSITTPVLIPVPFCNSGNKATIPVNTPTSPDEANYASYEAGFPPITMIPTEANGIPPRGVDFNGILYVISSNIQNWNAGVQMKFNSDFCTAIGGYPRGAVLQADDNSASYVSAIDNNTGDFNGNPELIGTDWLLYGGGGNSIRFAVAGGSSDIITVTYENPVTELTDGMIVCFQATAANVTTTPSFNPDGLGAVTIVKGANQPLSEGDISGEGYLAILQYSATWNKWVLQNPAKGIDVSTGVPVGTVIYFSATSVPAGYLKCDGSAVGRATYPELYAAIGTTYGAGDGSTTFNLPNLIGRFAEGSATPGTVKEAGLPNITGEINGHFGSSVAYGTGSLFTSIGGSRYRATPDGTGGEAFFAAFISASRSSPIYGNSDTVQPPALTLLPCIKAFDAAVNPGLIDITELANEVAGKADTNLSNLSATGKTKVANLAMPSGIYVDLTLPTSGQHITAPADGYVYLEKYAANQAEYIVMHANYIGLGEAASSRNQILRVTLPVKKGSFVTPTYTASGTTTAFRFTYAEGSQP